MYANSVVDFSHASPHIMQSDFRCKLFPFNAFTRVNPGEAKMEMIMYCSLITDARRWSTTLVDSHAYSREYSIYTSFDNLFTAYRTR
jgi:hypothetical protein